MINLREIEREIDPCGGNLGEGVLISKKDLESLDYSGYTPFVSATAENAVEFPTYGCDGRPTVRKWRAFIRKEDDRVYCAAVEYYDI